MAKIGIPKQEVSENFSTFRGVMHCKRSVPICSFNVVALVHERNIIHVRFHGACCFSKCFQDAFEVLLLTSAATLCPPDTCDLTMIMSGFTSFFCLCSHLSQCR
eukprot:5067536-Amphidinium_carterae.1